MRCNLHLAICYSKINPRRVISILWLSSFPNMLIIGHKIFIWNVEYPWKLVIMLVNVIKVLSIIANNSWLKKKIASDSGWWERSWPFSPKNVTLLNWSGTQMPLNVDTDLYYLNINFYSGWDSLRFDSPSIFYVIWFIRL